MHYYRTGIATLDALLLPHIRRTGEAEDFVKGIAYDSDSGFFGAVVGSAGAGKSILALQLAASCVTATTNAEAGVFTEEGTKIARIAKYNSIFITQESTAILSQKLNSFGWLGGAQILTRSNRTEGDNFLGFAQSRLHLVQFDLTPQSQTDVLTNIFHALARSGGSNEEQFTLICFDNAETIADATFTQIVGYSPDNKNFYKAIRQFCREQKLHVIMFFEEERITGVSKPHTGKTSQEVDTARTEWSPQIANSAQAYAADVVIQIGSYEFPSGYKERSIEIVKAKNQFHRRGRHHFSIVSGGTSAPGDARKTPGIVIYESLPTQLYRLRNAQLGSATERRASKLGIEDLDKRIAALASSEVKESGYLRPGTISVLVSDLDLRAQEIALHFALQPQSKGSRDKSERECVYVSFAHAWKALYEILRPFDQHRQWNPNAPGGFLYLQPEHISEGKLLQDVRNHIESRLGALDGGDSEVRVVIDNLYGLEAKFPLIANASHFITALFAMLKSLDVTALVIDTVDVGVGTDPLDKSFAAGLGQNVFLLRRVELHSREHAAFSVVQLLGQQTHERLWEIADVGHTLIARDTFKYYKGVIGGPVDPVTVQMSLHADAEESPLDKYLKQKKAALESSLGYRLTLSAYRPGDYAHVHGAFSYTRRQPLSDCHVISIDETWLEELLANDELEELGDDGRYEGAVTACHDLALYYVDNLRGKPGRLEQSYAIPDRNNCGVLLRRDERARRSALGGVFDKLNERIESRSLKWTHVIAAKKRILARSDVFRKGAFGFFTFCRDQAESCASFLLELALCNVPAKAQLVNEKRAIDLKSDVWRAALRLFVQLMERQDKLEIAQGEFRPTAKEPVALLSRQWFNTCFVKCEQESKIKGEVGELREESTVCELPRGRRQRPGVVSGAWYLGILKGSAAKEAGLDAIRQFTSARPGAPGEDLRKTNLGIGMPCRGEYYGEKTRALEVIKRLPYSDRFAEVGGIDSGKNMTGSKRIEKIYAASKREYPFYRMQIRGWRHVMPILWAMMVEAASRAVECRSNSGLFEIADRDAREICMEADKRYRNILRQIAHKS